MHPQSTEQLRYNHPAQSKLFSRGDKPSLIWLDILQRPVTNRNVQALRLTSHSLLVLTTSLLTALPGLSLAQPAWQRTTDYPTNGYQFDPVEAGGRIYVAGGFNGVSTSNVFYSAINTNDSLGAWASTTPLPEADPGPGVAAYSGWIYVALASGHVYRAAVQPSGTLGNWVAEALVDPATSYDTALKAYKGYLYL